MANPGSLNRWLVPLTLLLAAAAVTICFLVYELTWLSQRHELIDSHTVIAARNAATREAPRLLQLFQEPGYGELLYIPEGKPVPLYLLLADKPVRQLSAAELEQVRTAFPEAQLRPFGD